jgi:hypothetical protein
MSDPEVGKRGQKVLLRLCHRLLPVCERQILYVEVEYAFRYRPTESQVARDFRARVVGDEQSIRPGRIRGFLELPDLVFPEATNAPGTQLLRH